MFVAPIANCCLKKQQFIVLHSTIITLNRADVLDGDEAEKAESCFLHVSSTQILFSSRDGAHVQLW